MKKEWMYRVFVGLLIGVVIGYVMSIGISVVIGDGNFYPCVPGLIERFGNEVTAVIMQTVLSAVLGAGFAACSGIWEKDEWSLLKQTSIYFAAISVLMMSVSYICDWMEHSVIGVLSYFGIFCAIFVVVWIVRYLIWKVRISKIMESIQKKM